MSDDNKNLSDDLDDMIGDVKEGAKKAGDKISQKANEFSEDAKEAASDFANDAKAVLGDGKNVAIIAHFWWIGWVIALIMNSGDKKSELGAFYIRQVLGLLLLSFVSYALSFISAYVGGIFGLLLFVLWVMSLIGSLSGEKKPVPVIGEQFQDWFKSL